MRLSFKSQDAAAIAAMEDPMNVDHLLEYVELAKHLNFTETARLLNMTQPTLSKHISALESELKIELFSRTKDGLRLTNEGTTLLPYAYKVVDAQNDFIGEVRALRKAPPSRLVVNGLTDEGPSTEVLGFLVSLVNEADAPGFLEINPDHDMTPNESLLGNRADMVFDPVREGEPLDTDEIEILLVGKLPLVAFVSATSSFAQYDELPLSAFKDAEFLKCEGIYISRSWCHINSACQKSGFTPRACSHYCPNTAALMATCANLGRSVLLLGSNFADRIPAGIKPLCKAVRLTDEYAIVPLRLLFRKSNPNPLLKHVVKRIKEMPSPPIEF